MYNYSYINFFMYPAGAGGKFLLNCVSLNNRTVLQDHVLAQQQLSGQFNVDAKLKYIYKKLKLAQETKQWTDLGLGDYELWGFNVLKYVEAFPEITKKLLDSISLIQECMTKNIHLPIVCHNFIMLENMRKVWINGKVVVFTNYRKFVNTRNLGYNNDQKLESYWNTIKGDDWPTDPPTTKAAIRQLPVFIQHELSQDFNNEIERYLDFGEDYDQLWNTYAKNLDTKFIFDVEYSYENSRNFYEVYLEVCAYLGVPAANQPIIEKYFNTWKKTLSIISQSSAQE